MIDIKEHLGLVGMVLKKNFFINDNYEDLFQIGCIGLIKAAKKFDSSKGFKFSTFATNYIYLEILKNFRDGSWFRGKREGRPDKPIFLGNTIGKDENIDLLNLIKVDDFTPKVLLKIYINSLLKELDNIERYIIFQYFYNNKSQKKIAIELGKTQSRISSIYRQALSKMRMAAMA